MNSEEGSKIHQYSEGNVHNNRQGFFPFVNINQKEIEASIKEQHRGYAEAAKVYYCVVCSSAERINQEIENLRIRQRATDKNHLSVGFLSNNFLDTSIFDDVDTSQHLSEMNDGFSRDAENLYNDMKQVGSDFWIALLQHVKRSGT